ncbi:MAG: transketolase C-terminal domain-containing protein [Pseudomonadota bacterium]
MASQPLQGPHIIAAKAGSAFRPADNVIDENIDWRQVVYQVQLSRALDEIEETQLVPQKKVLYQFSARGHDMAQVLLGLQLTHRHDAICGYYRSRPVLLSLGVDLVEALRSSMAREGGYSSGRDIGTVFNYPNKAGASALPMCGGVGAQYTPAVGWAQAVKYRAEVLGDADYAGAIGVALGGEASVATNGFWSALTIATTQHLPMLFYIEDNGYGISVPSTFQTPGADIAANLRSFKNLTILSGDGTEPAEASAYIKDAVTHIRAGQGPVLLRLTVPRLQGHSFQDTQTYKSEDFVAAEWAPDPLPKLKDHVVPAVMTKAAWTKLETRAKKAVAEAAADADALALAAPETVEDFVFSDPARPQVMGGLRGAWRPPSGTEDRHPEGARINMVTAIRKVLDHELSVNEKMVIFGEDVGPKGGVHAVTLGLQDKFGEARVFDTSLSEEGIVGRAVGMAANGLLPVPEIQFRKYADPAVEQINDCGTMRWRTNNRFAAPIVLRMPIGFFKCGDPWHSQTNEVQFVHSPGWKVAAPSNAEDAVGLLRTSLRGDDPVMFLEHRAMLDAAWARRAYPGDDYMRPFGKAKITAEGDAITIVTWGAMVERCERAAKSAGVAAEVMDLRTLMPWDKKAVLASIAKTSRCLIVHEDLRTGGFGGEIAAEVAERAFTDLDAPVARLTMPDIPSPHNAALLDYAVPNEGVIAAKLQELVAF